MDLLYPCRYLCLLCVVCTQRGFTGPLHRHGEHHSGDQQPRGRAENRATAAGTYPGEVRSFIVVHYTCIAVGEAKCLVVP